MIQGTTPKHTFVLDVDVDQIEKVNILYTQEGYIVLKKTTEDCEFDSENKSVAVTLSQKDTFDFNSEAKVEVQVRLLLKDGQALASDPVKMSVSRCFDNEVIE